MKSIGLVTAAMLIALPGLATAQCAGWGHDKDQTAESTYTPIPVQEPVEVVENPLLLILPEEGETKAEG